MTGQNLLIALVIACILVIVISSIYACLAVGAFAIDGAEFSIPKVFAYVRQLTGTIGICLGPILLILAFALLQRFRIK